MIKDETKTKAGREKQKNKDANQKKNEEIKAAEDWKLIKKEFGMRKSDS